MVSEDHDRVPHEFTCGWRNNVLSPYGIYFKSCLIITRNVALEFKHKALMYNCAHCQLCVFSTVFGIAQKRSDIKSVSMMAVKYLSFHMIFEHNYK